MPVDLYSWYETTGMMKINDGSPSRGKGYLSGLASKVVMYPNQDRTYHAQLTPSGCSEPGSSLVRPLEVVL